MAELINYLSLTLSTTATLSFFLEKIYHYTQTHLDSKYDANFGLGYLFYLSSQTQTEKLINVDWTYL